MQGNRKNGYDNPYQNVDPYKQVEINEAPKTKKSYKGNIVMADEISIENIGECRCFSFFMILIPFHMTNCIENA